MKYLAVPLTILAVVLVVMVARPTHSQATATDPQLAQILDQLKILNKRLGDRADGLYSVNEQLAIVRNAVGRNVSGSSRSMLSQLREICYALTKSLSRC